MADLMRPFAGEFDRDAAGHLLRRCGFGPTPAELDAAAALGLHGCVDRLMDFPDAPSDETGGGPDASPLADITTNFADRRRQRRGVTDDGELDRLRMQHRVASRRLLSGVVDWWVGRMADGSTPLKEKLVLFWHGHFTTSFKALGDNAYMMWPQHELHRTHAGGNFRAYVRAISRDPAMIIYLNGQQNRKNSPNENYARELMELFTLGIGNYGEQDIKQAARAFTGWGTDGDGFVFRNGQHDPGRKQLFGRAGTFGGDDVIDILLAHPACSRYLATRLIRYFVTDTPDPDAVESLSAVLRDHNYELRPAYDVLFRSAYFFDTAHRLRRVKSPVELVVGLCRQLGVDVPPFGQRRPHMQKMGQELFAPPNVKGWPGGRAWINTSTLLARNNACVALVNDTGRPVWDGESDAATFVDTWLGRLIPTDLAADRRATLIEAAGGEGGQISEPTARAALQLIVTMPEYQVC